MPSAPLRLVQYFGLMFLHESHSPQMPRKLTEPIRSPSLKAAAAFLPALTTVPVCPREVLLGLVGRKLTSRFVRSGDGQILAQRHRRLTLEDHCEGNECDASTYSEWTC
jgi:hypothetical protein